MLASRFLYLVATRHADVLDQEKVVFSKAGNLTLRLPAKVEFLRVIVIFLVNVFEHGWHVWIPKDTDGFWWPHGFHTPPLRLDGSFHSPLPSLSPLHLDDADFSKLSLVSQPLGCLLSILPSSANLVECSPEVHISQLAGFASMQFNKTLLWIMSLLISGTICHLSPYYPYVVDV